jgi:hypothetical protein
MSSNMEVSRKLANEALANYNFGSDVTVEAVNGWESNSRDTEMSCAVFLKFDTDEPEDDTNLGRFTVDFKDGKVSYTSCCCAGHLIGTPIWEF